MRVNIGTDWGVSLMFICITNLPGQRGGELEQKLSLFKDQVATLQAAQKRTEVCAWSCAVIRIPRFHMVKGAVCGMQDDDSHTLARTLQRGAGQMQVFLSRWFSRGRKAC